MPRRDFCPCPVDFGLCLFEPHETCPETEQAKNEIIVERASTIFAFSILFSTCKAPVPQLGALSIKCCPPSFRCTRNRVVSFNLTRPPTLTRFHIKEALILSASLPQRKTNKNISLSLGCQTSAHCQSVADCQRLMRSLRVAKLQEVLGQFHDVQVTFTSATLSKTPGLLDIS